MLASAEAYGLTFYVEGTETAVLLGARRIVRDLRPILLIEVRLHPAPETERIIRSCRLSAIGCDAPSDGVSPAAAPPRNG
jgi:hypothetical protein